MFVFQEVSFMAKKEKRFVRTHTESSALEENSIWVDGETVLIYLWHSAGHAGGMTPLLDREGKPIITTVLEEKE